VRDYQVVLQPKAWTVLAKIVGRNKRRLLALLEELQDEPFRAGDFQQQDDTGRWNEVALMENWLVTYWCDHAVREIRVVNLQKVER
jgi:hypothetical protein